MITIAHNRVQLALHELRPGADDQRALLVLHGLGERTASQPPAWTERWNGPVFGLDFTGHGASTVPTGGGYTAEILIGDVDAALAYLDRPVVLAGRGLGAYISLLAGGARPDLIDGIVLGDGPGLGGGPDQPTTNAVISGIGRATTPDPYALIELAHDLRPTDYAIEFAQIIARNAEIAEPIQIAARFHPPWLDAVVHQPGATMVGSIAEGIAALA